MFFAVNNVGIQDAQRILNYQLFQIAKNLTSGELLLLKALETAYRNGVFPGHDERMNLDLWTMKVAGHMGHGLTFLVLRDSHALEQQGLINTKEVEPTMRTAPGGSGQYAVNSRNARLTDLGFKFCENIRNYQIEMSE